MGSKTRLSSYCTKRANNGVNLVMSRKIITRLARPIIALHSVNNNNMVYAFDPLNMPFLSHKGFGNEKNCLWLTLFSEVFGLPHTTQVTI